jgi:hypothetical protein
MNPLHKDGDNDDGQITHSICDECADNLDFQMGVSITKYVDSLKIPIIVLDRNGKVIAVNNKARKLHRDKNLATTATWNDKIFECAHARLPEGCMSAVHCSGCAIRFITANTYRTGMSQQDVPAYFNSCSADSAEKIELLLSAEKIENIIFLRVVKL